MKRTKNVVSLAEAKRTRRRRPWVFTVDLAADRFHLAVGHGATALDIVALVEQTEVWGAALTKMGAGLRAQLLPGVSKPKRGARR